MECKSSKSNCQPSALFVLHSSDIAPNRRVSKTAVVEVMRPVMRPARITRQRPNRQRLIPSLGAGNDCSYTCGPGWCFSEGAEPRKASRARRGGTGDDVTGVPVRSSRSSRRAIGDGPASPTLMGWLDRFTERLWDARPRAAIAAGRSTHALAESRHRTRDTLVRCLTHAKLLGICVGSGAGGWNLTSPPPEIRVRVGPTSRYKNADRSRRPMIPADGPTQTDYQWV
jgi:hypothetical protein